MSDVLYSKLRLEVPQELDGEDATITSEHGNTRTVEMSSPITDVMLAGMEKYRVQAGVTDEDVSFGYGEIKKVEAIYRPPTIYLKKLPYNFYNGSAVVLNNEIHILGGEGNLKKHYKWNGSNWVSVSTLPYNFYRGSVVVLNNEIHILGTSYTGDTTKHYKWNGTSWTSVSTLPYDFYGGSAVVLNNEIHILGCAPNVSRTKHYKWNGSRWTSVSTLPVQYVRNPAVVLNNEIHIFGSITDSSYNTTRFHYKWNGSSWQSLNIASSLWGEGSAVVYNNKIHYLGGYYQISSTTYGYRRDLYIYNDESDTWTAYTPAPLPYGFARGSAVVTNYEGNIVILGTELNNYRNYDAQYNGETWLVGED